MAQKIAQQFSNIQHFLVDDGPFSPYTSIEYSLKKRGQPIVPIINSYWINNIIRKAKEQNCKVILSGQHGNYTISWPSIIYVSNKTPKEFLSNQMSYKNYVKSILPSWFVWRYVELKNQRYPFLKRSFINNTIFSDVKEDNVFGNNLSVRDLYTMSLKDLQIQMLKPGKSIAGAAMHEMSGSEGIEMRDPTIDKRIIDFCTSLPDKYYIQNGNMRLLVKKAMSNTLPNEIINYAARGKQSSDVHFRIKADKEKFNSDLQNLANNQKCNLYVNMEKTMTYLTNLNIENNYYTYRNDNAFLRAFQTCKYLIEN